MKTGLKFEGAQVNLWFIFIVYNMYGFQKENIKTIYSSTNFSFKLLE